jgi:hypothetical protein
MARSEVIEAVLTDDEVHQTPTMPCECTKCKGRFKRRTTRCPGCDALNTLLPIVKPKADMVFSHDQVKPFALVADMKHRTRSIVFGRRERDDDDDDFRGGRKSRADDDKDDSKFDDDRDDLPEAHTVSESKFIDHERISTGFDSLDRQLSPRKLWKKGAGIALGRLYGVTGPPSSGKSSVFLQVLMNTSAAGATSVLIDGEEVFEDSMSMINSIAPALGINKKKDLSDLHVIDDCRIIEKAFEKCEELDADVVLINSLQEFKSIELEEAVGGPFMAGNPAQKKAVIRSALEFAKGKGQWTRPRAVIIVIQVKGDGEMDGEGNKVLHKVDVMMEADPDPDFLVPGSDGELRMFLKFVEKKSRGLDPSVVSAWRRVRADSSMEELGLVEPEAKKRRAPRAAQKK